MAVTSNEILVLLDKNLKRIGTISPSSQDNAFWGESFNRQIADDSSSNDEITALDTFNRTDPNANSKMWGDELTGLTMTQDAPMAKNLVIGNSIARYNEDIGKWEIYRIITTDESIDESTGRHLVSVEATNLAIWHLGKTIPAKKEIKECNIVQAMDWILSGSGWDLENNSESGLLADMQFDGSTSSQSYLQTILTTYDCEVTAYAHFDASGLVDDLILELTDHMGSTEPTQTVRYGTNMKSIHRKTVDTTLITKLYVYGSDGTSIGSVNNGRDFITDAQANAMYNNDQNTWLEGAITSSSIKQPAGLMAWAEKQLRLYNHPRINYTVEVSSDFNPKLGDEIKVIDTVMTPDLTVQARVIQKQESISNSYGNTVTLGEFSTVKVVTPNFIKSLQEEYSNQVSRLFEQARADSTASSINLITPLGRTWYNDDTIKKCIARLFIEGQNVTSYLTNDSFNWQYIKNDGTHDTAWEAENREAGYEVTIEPGFVGTLLCSINDDHTATQPEIYVDDGNQSITNSHSAPSDEDGKYSHNEGDGWLQTDNNNNAIAGWRFRSGQWQSVDPSSLYSTRLNKNGTFKRIWQTHYNQNYWKDNMYGGLQCANYMEDGNVIGSYAYNGNHSSQKLWNIKTNDTEFIRFNQNGDLMDAMILHGGGHGSSFTYNKNDHRIYTMVKDYNGDGSWYVGALYYEPNTDATIDKFVWRCKVDKFMRPVFQFSSTNDENYMLGTQMDGTYVVCKLIDLQNGHYNPLIQGKLQDFGITPSVGQSNGETNTMQANGINYPYAFFTMGDANNKDPKQVLAINLVTQSQEFIYPFIEGNDIELDIPVEAGGAFEPEGVYYDNETNSLFVGFNISEYTDNTKKVARPVSIMVSVPIAERQDVVNNALKYPIDDSDLSIFNDDTFNPSDSDSDNQDGGYDISVQTEIDNEPINVMNQYISQNNVSDTINALNNWKYTNVDLSKVHFPSKKKKKK